MSDKDDGRFYAVLIVAIVAGLLVGGGLVLWRHSRQPTAAQTAATSASHLSETLAQLQAGVPVPPPAAAPAPPWPERYPWLVAIATFAIVLVAGRGLLFVRAVQARSRRE